MKKTIKKISIRLVIAALVSWIPFISDDVKKWIMLALFGGI